MLTGKRIMIVEDSKTIIFQVRLIMEKLGASFIQVGSEWAMYKKIEEYGEIVDLIIMDLVLKYENGFELVEKLKNDDKYKKIPIIILTEHADIDSVLKAKELGVNCYIRKPIRKSKLIEKLNNIFS